MSAACNPPCWLKNKKRCKEASCTSPLERFLRTAWPRDKHNQCLTTRGSVHHPQPGHSRDQAWLPPAAMRCQGSAAAVKFAAQPKSIRALPATDRPTPTCTWGLDKPRRLLSPRTLASRPRGRSKCPRSMARTCAAGTTPGRKFRRRCCNALPTPSTMTPQRRTWLSPRRRILRGSNIARPMQPEMATMTARGASGLQAVSILERQDPVSELVGLASEASWESTLTPARASGSRLSLVPEGTDSPRMAGS